MSNQRKQLVVGTFFGDEGKGNTVQWLCKEAIARGEKPLVVRFSGGAQSGHRVINNGTEHVCSLFGSGVLLGVPTVFTRHVFIDPVSLKNEYDVLVSKGITPKFNIDYYCRIVTPYDILYGKNSDKIVKDGTCGCGIYATYKRYHELDKISGELTSSKLYLDKVFDYYKKLDENLERNSEADEEFLDACKWLLHKLLEADVVDPDAGDIRIYESSQGLLLDMDSGFMPNCTPSKVGLNAFQRDSLQDFEIFLTTRAYLTRHGNGYFPFTKPIDKYFNDLSEPTNLDTSIQGVFRKGMHTSELISRVVDRCHLDNYNDLVKYNLVITHTDNLSDSQEQIPVNFGGTVEMFKPSEFAAIFESNGIKFNKIYLGKSADSNIIEYST